MVGPDVFTSGKGIVPFEQAALFALLAGVFVFLVWGRWRYDLVAFVALLLGVLLGVVPASEAFVGLGHPATVIIALVLIVSRGLSNAGVIEMISRLVVDKTRSLARHVTVMSSFAAAMSAVMNNVAALTLLMPVDMHAADKAKRSPALTLMPISFASILGGMITLIGTPPNIVIAEYRNEALGEPFKMFDFAPVGLACTVVGVAYLALIGWRLLPGERKQTDSGKALFELADYIVELSVPEQSMVVGRAVRDLDDEAGEIGVDLLGLIRRGRRMPGLARRIEIRPGDKLVVEATPAQIDELLATFGLDYGGKGVAALREDSLSLTEVVVPETSSLAGRSASSLRLLYRYGVSLVGVSRQGRRFREHVRALDIEPGDVLLMLGTEERLTDVVTRLSLLPLQDRGQRVLQRDKVWLAGGLFAGAILAASVGIVYLPVALGLVAAAYVATNIVPLESLYNSVEWPVIVLLGCMIPLGGALEATGGTALIVDGLMMIASGASPLLVLTLLIVVTMTLSDVMNNTATAVIAAPIAVETAARLGANSDAFLMGVAVAASCAFLTPIGHKNNTLIMGPGGYRFGDYWRMGLPLEILVVAISVPAIAWVWPL